MTDTRVEDRLRDLLHGDAELLRPSPLPPPELRPRIRRRVARNAGVAVLSVTVLAAGAVAGLRAVDRGTPPPIGTAPVCTWSAVPAPSRDAEGLDTSLRSVTAAAPDEAIAVGRANVRQEGGHEFLALQQWDGTAWTSMQAPDVPSYGTGPVVMAIDASAPGAAWAVGFTDVERGGVPLALHWDGIAWQQTGFPENAQPESHLFAVSAVADDDVWGVGGWARPGALEGGALVAHWDGSGWTSTDLPTSDRPEGEAAHHYDALYGVEAVSGSDAWAVGTRFDVPVTFGRTLVEHWNGASWEVVPSPNVDPAGTGGNLDNSLAAVAAIGANDVWAVGTYQERGNVQQGPSSNRPLAMHWDGSAWRIVAVPDVGQGELNGIAAVSADDVWGVGSSWQAGSARRSPLLLHWDGRAWTSIEAPTDGPGELAGVAAIPGGGLWAVGWQGAGAAPTRSLVYRCT
jgi:hypothetical protein